MNGRLPFLALVAACLVATSHWMRTDALPASMMQQPAASPASRPQSPLAAVEACIRSLVDEAKRSKAQGSLVRTQPTFAKEFGESLPPTMLVDRMLKPQHDDAFIDAYVRWQLTGFRPPVHELALDERQFARLLDGLPAPTRNPRADEDLLRVLNRTVQIGPLDADQQQEVNTLLNDLAARTSAVAALNVPAIELRTWLLDQFRAQPYRSAALRLERVASLAKAGWFAETEDAKADLERGLQTLTLDRAFTAQQRQAFVDHAARTVSTGVVVVAAAGLAGDALSVEYASVAVFDFNVRRWEAILRRD